MQTVILFLSIPIAITLVEPTIHEENKIDRSIKAILGVVKFAIVENVKLRWLIIYSSTMGVATLAMAWFAQPYFRELEIPLAYFGILWALLNFSAGLTSLNSHKFDKSDSNTKMLLYVALAMATSFLFLGYKISLFGIIFIVFIYLFRGIITPILRNAINKNTSSNKRVKK